MTIQNQLEVLFLGHLHEEWSGFLTPDQWKQRQSKHKRELVRIDAPAEWGVDWQRRSENRNKIVDRLKTLKREPYIESYLAYYFADYPKLVRLLAHHYRSPVRKETLRRHIKPLINSGRTSPFYPSGERSSQFLGSVLAAVDEAIEDVRLKEKLCDRARKKPGPKGPHKKVAQRRLKIMALGKMGNRKLCHRLTEEKTPLPTDELQVKYHGNWILWYEADREAVDRQLADDRRRAPGSEKS
jgi:hypothetical protein